MKGYDIPIVLILFKRCDTVLRIIERIRTVGPSKVYLLGDQGRNDKEKQEVSACRQAVERAIDWPCEVIKNYALENRGVHANIGLGAKWVFEREDKAIFLEDDNLPEVTFFEYCRELLDRYENDTRVLWICGTNYLGQYEAANGASYMFTQHLLPCGWASWADKFNKFYDVNLDLVYDEYVMTELAYSYSDRKLFEQQKMSIQREKRRRDDGKRFCSWDYHMALSIRAHNLLGISPVCNQIKNIGVDEHSIHGGSDIRNIMTKRFCGMESYPLVFPLVHPQTILVDHDYDKRISDIILLPLQYRIKGKIVSVIKKVLGIPQEQSLSKVLKRKRVE